MAQENLTPEGDWKETIREAVEDAMSEVPYGEVLVIDKIEVRKQNPIHEYRIVLGAKR
ncbi:MAG: hypothetical protein M3310_05305 [Actinomycetota bacterium]|nr:hypothetical protein [Actinomycetota bacterium]